MHAKNLDLAVPGTSFNFDWTEEEDDEPFNQYSMGESDDAKVMLSSFSMETIQW